MFSEEFRVSDEQSGLTWADLCNGTPTIIALAHLCAVVQSRPELPKVDPSQLSDEARALLISSRDRGTLSIRGDKNAFEPAERFLAVCVEKQEGQKLEFRSRDAEQTVKFMDGLRQLCACGLVMHQLMNDFSLTSQGFELARQLDAGAYQELLATGREAM